MKKINCGILHKVPCMLAVTLILSIIIYTCTIVALKHIFPCLIIFHPCNGDYGGQDSLQIEKIMSISEQGDY